MASSSEPRLEHACRAPAWKIHDRRGQRTLDLPLDLGELCARPPDRTIARRSRAFR